MAIRLQITGHFAGRLSHPVIMIDQASQAIRTNFIVLVSEALFTRGSKLQEGAEVLKAIHLRAAKRDSTYPKT